MMFNLDQTLTFRDDIINVQPKTMVEEPDSLPCHTMYIASTKPNDKEDAMVKVKGSNVA